jgi:hypothetical protein
MTGAMKFEVGREESRALLEKRIPGIDRVLDIELDDAPLTHPLDASGLLWTARRIFARAGTRLPTEPEWDEDGGIVWSSSAKRLLQRGYSPR